MNLKKIGKVVTSKFVGTGPSSYKKSIYRAEVSQRLRHTGFRPHGHQDWHKVRLEKRIYGEKSILSLRRLCTLQLFSCVSLHVHRENYLT